jgi:hypothetical protein
MLQDPSIYFQESSLQQAVLDKHHSPEQFLAQHLAVEDFSSEPVCRNQLAQARQSGWAGLVAWGGKFGEAAIATAVLSIFAASALQSPSPNSLPKQTELTTQTPQPTQTISLQLPLNSNHQF